VALQHEVLDLLDRLAWDPYSDSAFIRGVKTCLEVLGVCRAPVSRPFAGASDEERRHVAAALEPLVGVTQAG
jgi:dihydrodipicolinate synthase/N-acetylneuraminate lyase